MEKGYIGKILHVNLSQKKIYEERIPDKIYEKYLSGSGLGAYVLYRDIPEGADALGPDNVLGFVSGLLTGTGSLFTGRWMVTGKSPLTGGWGDANCGGLFSPAIKRCGYDGIFFTGISDDPVYLFVKNNKAELRDAAHVWGKDTVETEKLLIDESGSKKARVACIGPAGENKSLIAGISNDRGRMAARSGLGAVMGSKKLKAVVLAGSGRIRANNPEEMKKLSQKCNDYVMFQPPFIPGPLTAYVGSLVRILPFQIAQDGMLFKIMLKKWGTVSMNQFSVEMGDTPIKNWDGTSADFGPKKSKLVNPDVFTDCEIVKYHCYSCPLGCGGICSMNGRYQETHKPEYETVLSLGGFCMNEDKDSIFYMNELLNRAGMDTISAGNAAAFAIECYEKGIITKKDTDGLELKWGDTKSLVSLLEKMVTREGIGDILADGVKIASEKIGKKAQECAVHAGGQELAMHDGRNDPGYALHYSVEPAPGRHTVGSQLYYEMYQLWKKVDSVPKIKLTELYSKKSKYRTDEKKAAMAAACSKFMNVVNGAGACLFGMFLGVHRIPVFEWMNAATGWKKTPEDYMIAGESIQTLKQAFNIKHGIKPKDFTVSDRALGKPPQSRGANRDRTVNIEKLMQDYWRQFNWDDKTGIPQPGQIEKINVD
ncbi:aldehyde ferredoxin oxidoreductase family protein [Desulfobacterales bacterium HSG16]|nr:aldehyde ferredoxin oxidoreductase family protein [Desulfobacterales bacterium HSG16]